MIKTITKSKKRNRITRKLLIMLTTTIEMVILITITMKVRRPNKNNKMMRNQILGLKDIR